VCTQGCRFRRLANDPETNIVTGYYENRTGYEESCDCWKFSCIFYFEGRLKDNTVSINSYYPLGKEEDEIPGTLSAVKNNEITLKLDKEHGGCWNVQHFADEPVNLKQTERTNWIEIRYITINKSYFYSGNNETSKSRSYLIKGDIIYIDKIEGDWLHCKYYGRKYSEGWIKSETVNSIK
jgi:hypothetical protein